MRPILLNYCVNVKDQKDNMEGSKLITTEVGIQNIMLRMNDHAYYLGESLKSDPRMVEIGAKIQASDDENPILSDFINDATSITSNLLSRVMGETTYAKDDNTITFLTRATSNTPDIEEQIADYVVNYMATYILEKWLNVIKADESKRFTEDRSRLENEIVLLAARRSKPERS